MIRRIFFASPTSVTSTSIDDTIVLSADLTAIPAASSAACTSYTTFGALRHPPVVAVAGDVVGSGLERRHHQLVLVDDAVDVDDTLRLNCQPTAPGSAMLPPSLEKIVRMLAPVRLRLSVSVSTIIATPPGAYPS